ncbi:MAG TPA: hypothetical protein VF988_01520 [Verrucomicrobiae bacterium]
MKIVISARQSSAGAIRPLDVAAIICVLGVLAFIALVSANQWESHALRGRCANNLARLGQSLELYAADNHGELPDCSGADPRYGRVDWPWNIETNLVTELVAKGVSREMFYCPANPAMNDDRHWNFCRVFGGSSRVIGYGLLFRGTSTVPPNTWVAKLAGKTTTPSETELGFDATAGIGGDYTRIQGLWTDRSNHMRKLNPLGGNVLCADAHVEWRDFKHMGIRFRTFGPGGVIDWSY